MAGIFIEKHEWNKKLMYLSYDKSQEYMAGRFIEKHELELLT